MRRLFFVLPLVLLGACDAFGESYVSRCERSVKQYLKAPGSFKMVEVTYNTSTKRHGREVYVVSFTFDSQNGFGANLRGFANCVFIGDSGLVGINGKTMGYVAEK